MGAHYIVMSSKSQASDGVAGVGQRRRGMAGSGGDATSTPAETVDSTLSCPSCKRDLGERPRPARVQHIRKCKQPPAGATGYACQDCDRSFPTYIGLQQHRKKGHAAEYNQADAECAEQTEGRKRRWNTAEELKLAEIEVALGPNLSQMEINSRLSQESGRSVDAIKKRRKLESYLRALTMARDQANKPETLSGEEGSEPENQESEGSTQSLSGGDQSVQPSCDPVEPNHQEARSPPYLRLEPVDAPCRYIPSGEICATLRSVVEECSRPMAEIVQKILDDHMSLADLDESLSGFVHSLPGKTVPKRRQGRGKAKWRGGGKKRGKKQSERALRFKHLQEEYRKNPSHAAKMVLDETKPPDEVPPPEEVEEFYKSLFGIPADLPEPRGKTKGEINLFYPISRREIKQQLSKLKDSAKGPDGIARRDLRSANVHDLVAFANIVFGSRLVPAALRENRTTLLPKTGDLKSVTNWRPVTVSSLLLRLIHKVIASRLSKQVPLHSSQRGFTAQDGLLANTHVLQTVIRERKRLAQPLYLLSIDLAKAFDKVSPQVIRRALVRKSVDRHTIEYIMAIYRDVTTTITVGGTTSCIINIQRGVKQGDPTSGILFNLIIDSLLEELEEQFGVQVGVGEDGEPVRVAGMGFADDTVLLSDTPDGMQRHIRRLEGWLIASAMEVNVAKCKALQYVKVPTAKRTAVVTRPMFQINGIPVQCLEVGSQLKYLGLSYSERGVTQPGPQNLSLLLERLRKAALRPFQKMRILRTYLIPRLYHTLQTPAVNLKGLKFLDGLIRTFVKVTCHLPKTTPDAFLYARVKEGGLGLPLLELSIPTVYRRRMEKLEEKGDAYVRAALATPTMTQLKERLLKFCKGVRSAAQYHRRMRTNLEETALGSGLALNTNSRGSSWVYEPPSSWTGRDYVKAVQLRCGLLPTRGAPYIKDPKMAACRNTQCTKRSTRETLYHVLQRCPITHWARIERHDAVCEVLAHDLKEKGYSVSAEPRIRKSGKLFKPDLICVSPGGKTADIVEVSVAYEYRASLKAAYGLKAKAYTEIVDVVQRDFKVDSVRIVPWIVGARGGEHPSNIRLQREWGIDTSRATACLCLKYGAYIHRQFMASVWRKSMK